MRCAQVDLLVERHVDGLLELPAAREVEAHGRTCPRCAARIAAARRLRTALESEPAIQAPRGFTDAVMDAVYKEALAPRSRRSRTAGESTAASWGLARGREAPSMAGARPALGRMYRRLGFSFVVTAAVLAASLFIPRASYDTLLGVRESESGFVAGGSTAVQAVLQNADEAVMGILGEHRNGGSRR